MTDIIERAENALKGYPGQFSSAREQQVSLFAELVAELKSARAENERLREASSFADSILSLLRYRGIVDSERNREDVEKASELLERLR